MNEFIDVVWRTVFRRSLSSGPLKITVFFALLLLFVLILVVSNKLRKKREQEELRAAYRKKWKFFTAKYEISSREAELLEKMAGKLKDPEKKYVLLVDRHIFNSVLDRFMPMDTAEEQLVRSIMLKAGLKPVSEEMRGIALSRRKSKRVTVDIPLKIARAGPGEEYLPSRMHDLSARGASCDNPDGRFVTGDELLLDFSFKEKKYRAVAAEVVRISDDRARLHLSFHHSGALKR